MSSKSFLIFITLILTSSCEYEPTWESLDSRPLPTWYDEAKVGIFIVWGVYSVPGFGSEWFWRNWKDNVSSLVEFMNKNYKPGFTYQDFATDFTTEFYEPEKWAELLEASGAKYVVLTSKHHDGYTLWPSKYSFSWNSMDVGPHRDLIGELASAVRARNKVKFGLYHSLFEWFHPLWMEDKANKYSTNNFVHAKIIPEMKELIEKYQPEVLWSDGQWDAPDWYWNSTKFLAWLYNSSPVKDTIVSNDRWGDNTMCKHGDFYTCTDSYNPGVLQNHKWENCITIDTRSWGYRRNAVLSDLRPFENLIRELISTVSCGGNILINVGPTHDGMIAPIYEERLRSLGAWLGVNGEAVYSSKPWTFQNETVQTGVWYTKRESYVYATILDSPAGHILILNRPQIGKNNVVTVLGYQGSVKSQPGKTSGITIMLPEVSKVTSPLPWVIRLSDVTN